MKAKVVPTVFRIKDRDTYAYLIKLMGSILRKFTNP